MAKELRFCSKVCLALLTAAFSIASAWVARASAANVPYTDPYANGVIGFCNQNNQPITHGKIADQPFVWLSVSSTPAASGYAGPGETATLYAYQPRQGEDPGVWSGDQITAASYYTNGAHPMVEASSDAETLQQFIASYPPPWDNLIELRIYVGLPGQGIHNDTYPATDIQVSGDSWSVVHGGNVSCTAGYAVSSENGDPPNSTSTESPGPPSSGVSSSGPNVGSSGTAKSPPSLGAGASVGASSAPDGTSTSSGRSASATPGLAQAASGPTSTSGGGDGPAVAIVSAVVVLLLGALLAVRIRKNRGTKEPSGTSEA